jgi:hypothetical protein
METSQEENTYEFADVPVRKLRKYRNLLSKIKDDHQLREVDSKLRAIMNIDSSVEYLESLIHDRKSKQIS